MKKEQLISAIAASLSEMGAAVRISEIVPVQKRTNGRFGTVHANYIVGINGELYYSKDGNANLTWKCRNLTVGELESVLSEIQRMKRKVYVIMRDTCHDFQYNSKIEMATTSKAKAVARLSELKEQIKANAISIGWNIDMTECSIEAYEEGYASENHDYATLYETELS